MSCRKWEKELALHAGGDLPRHRVAVVERHLSECPACSAYVDALRAERRAWRRDMEALSEGRELHGLENVSEPIAPSSCMTGRLAYGLVAVLLFVGMIWWAAQPPARVLDTASVPLQEDSPPIVAHVDAPIQTVPREWEPQEETYTITPREKVVPIRMQTRNPNVVIYLVPQMKTENQPEKEMDHEPFV
jgi:anti-sigma factor RsiW